MAGYKSFLATKKYWIMFTTGTCDRYSGQYIGRESVDARPIYRSTVGRYLSLRKCLYKIFHRGTLRSFGVSGLSGTKINLPDPRCEATSLATWRHPNASNQLVWGNLSLQNKWRV